MTALVEKILVDRYYHRDSRRTATDIVRDFIITKQLIVTGGLVVDYALRLKGDKIYEDFAVPDYDFFSTENARDACELFEILRNSGLTNISLVPGIHPSTIKIFVYKDCVADITFIHKSLFEDIKKSALTYNGIMFRNPENQYVDMHRSLTYPYEGEPRETINNRWVKKDFERFCKLYGYYPLESKFPPVMQDHEHNIKSNYIAAGLYAVKFYLEKYEITKVAADHVYLMDDCDFKRFMTDYGKSIKKVQRFKSYLELLPERTEMLIEGIKYTVLHCANKTSIYYIDDQIAATKKTINNAKLRIASKNAKIENNELGMRIVSINFCVIYCFAMFRVTGMKLYDEYYKILLELLYRAYNEGNVDLYPSVTTYGEEKDKPIIVYTTEHPEAKIPQVHISSDNSEDENAEQIAKLPWKFEYEESVYVLDGSLIK